MMRFRTLSLTTVLSVLLSFGAAGEVPDTYIGEWEMDLRRTISALLEQSMPSQSGLDEAMLDKLAEAALKSMPVEATVVLIITDTTLSMSQEYSEVEESGKYRLIGGNSEQVVIEVSHENQESAIYTLRLIEGGLAMSQEECADDPQRCVRRQQHYAKKAQERIAQKNGPNKNLDGIVPQSESPPLQPEWTYFKKR